MEKDIKKIDWQIVAKRGINLPILLISSFIDIISDVDYFKKEEECNFNINYYRQCRGGRYFERQELENFKNFVWEKAKTSPDYIKRMANRYINNQLAFRNWAENLSFDGPEINYLDLFLKYRHYQKGIAHWYDYILINLFWGGYLSGKINFLEDETPYMDFCSGTARPLESFFEQEDFNNLVKNVSDSKIEEYLEKYRHMGMYYFFGHPWTKSDVEKRITEQLKDSNHHNSGHKKIINNEEFLAWADAKGLTKQDIDLIISLRELSYATQMTHSSLSRSIMFLEPLWQHICKLANLNSREEMSCLNLDEVEKLLRGDSSFLDELDLDLRNDADTIFVEGETKYFKPKDEEVLINHNQELIGDVISSGESAEGTVLLIKHIDDTKLVTKDSILVMVSAFPDYAPAISQAKAVVAEIGGILSHTGVVAREHKKLAIGGIDNITKILKNGDKVRIELNGKKATIKKI